MVDAMKRPNTCSAVSLRLGCVITTGGGSPGSRSARLRARALLTAITMARTGVLVAKQGRGVGGEWGVGAKERQYVEVSVATALHAQKRNGSWKPRPRLTAPERNDEDEDDS